MNKEVIAVNQDTSYTAGDRISNSSDGGQVGRVHTWLFRLVGWSFVAKTVWGSKRKVCVSVAVCGGEMWRSMLVRGLG